MDELQHVDVFKKHRKLNAAELKENADNFFKAMDFVSSVSPTPFSFAYFLTCALCRITTI